MYCVLLRAVINLLLRVFTIPSFVCCECELDASVFVSYFSVVIYQLSARHLPFPVHLSTNWYIKLLGHPPFLKDNPG